MLVGVVHALRRHRDVECVDNGATALALLRSGNEYDVVLCDLSVPQVGGAIVVFEIAVLNPGQSRRFVCLHGGAATSGDQALLDRLDHPTLEQPFTLEVAPLVIAGMLAGDR